MDSDSDNESVDDNEDDKDSGDAMLRAMGFRFSFAFSRHWHSHVNGLTQYPSWLPYASLASRSVSGQVCRYGCDTCGMETGTDTAESIRGPSP